MMRNNELQSNELVHGNDKSCHQPITTRTSSPNTRRRLVDFSQRKKQTVPIQGNDRVVESTTTSYPMRRTYSHAKNPMSLPSFQSVEKTMPSVAASEGDLVTFYLKRRTMKTSKDGPSSANATFLFRRTESGKTRLKWVQEQP